jgi:hypothetical protein
MLFNAKKNNNNNNLNLHNLKFYNFFEMIGYSYPNRITNLENGFSPFF